MSRSTLIVSALIGYAVGTGATWVTMNASSASVASAVSVADAKPSTEAIAIAISANPALCPKPEDTILKPSDEEATLAFRNRPNPMKFGNKEPTDIVKLGTCYKGTMTMVQCGADIDFGGNGQFQQRSIGFDQTPSGWTAVLF